MNFLLYKFFIHLKADDVRILSKKVLKIKEKTSQATTATQKQKKDKSNKFYFFIHLRVDDVRILLKKILKIKDCLLNICSLFMNFKILILLNCV